MAHQSATCSWQGPGSLLAGSGDRGQWGSPGWALATLGREESHPVFSQSRGLGALPGAFQARSPSSLASATRLAPPGVVGTVSCRRLRTSSSGLESCKGPAHRGDSGPAREQRPAFPTSQAVRGKMGPGSQRTLVLLLLLLASPGARAFQVSVPAARLGVPLPREGSTEAGACHVPLLSWSWDLERNLGLGIS